MYSDNGFCYDGHGCARNELLTPRYGLYARRGSRFLHTGGAFMFEQRNFKRDCAALALLGFTVFLAVALLSYDPADPPTTLVYPANDFVANACCLSGATAASFLFDSFGLGAFYLIGSLAVLDLLLLARREIDEPVLRTIGWGVSLIGVTAVAAMAMPNLSPGPVIGSGGYLGATGQGLLEMQFATAGAYIVAAFVDRLCLAENRGMDRRTICRGCHSGRSNHCVTTCGRRGGRRRRGGMGRGRRRRRRGGGRPHQRSEG